MRVWTCRLRYRIPAVFTHMIPYVMTLAFREREREFLSVPLRFGITETLDVTAAVHFQALKRTMKEDEPFPDDEDQILSGRFVRSTTCVDAGCHGCHRAEPDALPVGRSHVGPYWRTRVVRRLQNALTMTSRTRRAPDQCNGPTGRRIQTPSWRRKATEGVPVVSPTTVVRANHVPAWRVCPVTRGGTDVSKLCSTSGSNARVPV